MDEVEVSIRETLNVEQESTGWRAEVKGRPGTRAYGRTRIDALNCALALALRIRATQFEASAQS